MKKILKIIVILFSLLFVLLWATDKTYLLKAARVIYLRGQTGVGIDDYTVQATQKIKAVPGKPWALHEKYNQIPLSDEVLKMHGTLKTTAFIIVKDGKILSENYFNEGNKKHMSGVWSVTKTYTSLLLLKAVEDGLIDNIDDPVSKYVPEWDVEQEKTLTLRHLASMSTGLYWEELDQTPLSLIAKLNFYSDLEKYTLNDLYAVGEPGDIQHYDSGALQLAGTVLDRVLGDKSISDYLSEKLWQPLGATQDALFILDSKKHKNEKTYCGLVACARDVSRLGQVLINDGKWNGKEILNPEQLKMIKTIPYNNKTYAYGIWTGLYQGKRFFYQSGHLGQVCISFPEHQLVITRLGHHATKKGDIEDVSPDVITYIAEALRIVETASK